MATLRERMVVSTELQPVMGRAPEPSLSRAAGAGFRWAWGLAALLRCVAEGGSSSPMKKVAPKYRGHLRYGAISIQGSVHRRLVYGRSVRGRHVSS